MEQIYMVDIIDSQYFIDAIKKEMSHQRFIHTLGVAEMAKELALIHGVDQSRVEIAALLHDISKENSKEELRKIVLEYFPDEITPKDLDSSEIMHGFAGAAVAKIKYKIDDEEILDAIKYHTIGKAGLSLLGRIIYISDAIEKNRNYPGLEEIRKCVRENLNCGIIFEISHIIEHLNECRKYVHPNTKDMYKWLVSINDISPLCIDKLGG